MKKEQAIAKAREVHGDKYGYNRLPEDVDYKTKYEIFCVKHQEYFSQSLKDHIYSKRGCRKCSHEALVQLRIQSAKVKFKEYTNTRNEGYIYDWDSYVDVRKPMNIFCNIHGWFKQSPNGHSSGSGCKLCAVDKTSRSHKYTQEYFVEKASIVHNFRYDYSKSNYNGALKPVTITCIEHQCDFEQKACEHLSGSSGCKACVLKYSTKKQRLYPPEEVNEILNKVHKNKYQYNVTSSIKIRDRIEIVCPIHHTFIQRFDHHKYGSGCPKCASVSKADIFSMTNEEYIAKANKVHNNFYDYSKTIYKNSKSKVVIICPIHQEFKQNAASHLAGCGCPDCGLTGFQPQNPATFYIFKVTDNVIKFGITNNLNRRFKEVRSKSCYDVEILYQFNFDVGYIARDIERVILSDKSISKCVVSKADLPSGYTETTYIYNLSKILQIVENFTNAPSL
jgi:hypothetical protein